MKNSNQTSAQQAKAAGLKSLTQVSQITGVSLNTLTNWHKYKPDLFAVVIDGCVSRKHELTDSEHIAIKALLAKMRGDK